MASKTNEGHEDDCLSGSEQDSHPEVDTVSGPFPRRLYELLENTDPSIVSWGEDEKTIHIHNPNAFATLALPKYFRHSNMRVCFRKFSNAYMKIGTYSQYPLCVS
mmetsp:Transcript_63319/g.142810  ORF Transcript_63319/g.142810 Transcript_63319/m.142810 type:complete len:105 (+) Transcript_63319:79-393(+)